MSSGTGASICPGSGDGVALGDAARGDSLGAGEGCKPSPGLSLSPPQPAIIPADPMTVAIDTATIIFFQRNVSRNMGILLTRLRRWTRHVDFTPEPAVFL